MKSIFFTPSTMAILCVTLIVSQLIALSSDAETIRRIPVAEGLASHPVNGGHCLISDPTFQYLAFYDGDHHMTVAKRRLGEERWEFAQLPEQVGWDSHNSILLFQDRDGYLHITGNMHGGPLRYYRTREPRDIQTFEAIHKWTADETEQRVTYPDLLKRRDGSLHLLYRYGGSGNGMRILIHYDEEAKQWYKTHPSLINGREHQPTVNAYPFAVVAFDAVADIPSNGILEDKHGVLHITWCWRETPDVETNFDLCYAKSVDGGQAWSGWDGVELELPITPSNAHVVERIPQESGLMNGGTLAVDSQGRPYIGYTRFDQEGNNQMYIATPEDDEWRVIQLSDWKHRFYFHGRGTIPEYPPIPRVTVDANDIIHVEYGYAHAEPRRGTLSISRDQLLNLQPGELSFEPTRGRAAPIPHIRAVNHGPLPDGWRHFMQQQVDPPNRDRRPENPREPTMIYLVEYRND